MPLVDLEVPPIPPKAVWTHFLLNSLASSGMIRIIPGDLPVIDGGRRWRNNFHFARMRGVTFAIDTWDAQRPSAEGHALFHSLDLLLKIEYAPSPIWTDLEQTYGLRVAPWTMFGYDDVLAGYFDWAREPHEHLCAFSGIGWRGRRPWLDHIQRRGWPVLPGQKPDEYLPLIRTMQWGVVLQGRKPPHCDGKNRREHAYTSCGMPLALNYIPHYPFPMEPDRDFVYLRAPADLDRLADIDPAPYAEASRRLWRHCFSPAGMAATLLKLIDECREGRGDRHC